MATTYSAKSTKPELLKAIKDLQKQVTDLEKEKKAAQVTVDEPEESDEAAVPAPVKPGVATVDDVISSLDDIKTKFGSAAGGLQHQLTEEASRLQVLNSEISEQQGVLKDLHAIEAKEGTLDELMTRYKKSAEQMQTDLTTRRKTVAEELESKRVAWRKEQSERNERERDREREQKTQKKRGEDEYRYETTQKGKHDEDGLKQQLKALQSELDGLKEERERAWAEREKELAKKEREAAELKEKAEALPKELEKATKRAEEEGSAIARRQTQNQKNLILKEFEGKRRVYDLKVGSLEETIAKQGQQILELSKQLATIQKQAQDLAVKALESSSHSSSFDAIKEIALEQAKNVQKGK